MNQPLLDCQTVKRLYRYYHLGRVDPAVGSLIRRHIDEDRCNDCTVTVAHFLMQYDLCTNKRSLDDDEPDDPVDWY